MGVDMLNEGHWIYQKAKTVHVFSLARVVEAGTPDEWYDPLGTIQVATDRRNPDKLGERLRPWALATLAAGNHAFGRYYAAFGTLDEDGEPDRAFAHEIIDWSGTTVLIPAS